MIKHSCFEEWKTRDRSLWTLSPKWFVRIYHPGLKGSSSLFGITYRSHSESWKIYPKKYRKISFFPLFYFQVPTFNLYSFRKLLDFLESIHDNNTVWAFIKISTTPNDWKEKEIVRQLPCQPSCLGLKIKREWSRTLLLSIQIRDMQKKDKPRENEAKKG